MAEFIVELYVSRTEGDRVGRDERQAREAAAELTAEGTPVRLLRSIYVPEDETCFLLYEASSVDAVHAAAHRAALMFEHVAETARTTSHSSPRKDVS
jgi:hypothetical protein